MLLLGLRPVTWDAVVADVGLVSLGIIGLWRYGWALTHLVRALVYRQWIWPRLRRQADALAATVPAAPLAVVVTAYQMPEAVFKGTFCALIGAVTDYPAPVTLIAAVTDLAEEQLLLALYARMGAPAHVRLVLLVQDGSGKRRALALALRQVPTLAEDGLVILMDGDTLVRPETFTELRGLFAGNSRLGAVTVHNASWSDGGLLTREWHALRMAQRHVMMLSQALSRRVLVLTGRFSVFRSSIATDPVFVAMVERDTLRHWRYGAIPFITGDDKSTWLHVLRGGWEMRYVPDISVDCVEPVIHRRFVHHSLPLMRRWYGNMLRNSARARALGPRRMPVFTWWSLWDQSLSMWTALLTPAGMVLLAVADNPVWLWRYAVWVLLTRMLYGILIGVGVGRLSPWWPFLLFYNQISGAVLKIHALFRLPRQRWTRQRLTAPASNPTSGLAVQYRVAMAFECTAWLVFGWVTLWLTGLAGLPQF
jgi:mannuronan synthase